MIEYTRNCPNCKKEQIFYSKIRQQNIIKYFELLGRPLTGFIRIKADKNGNVLRTERVYKGGS